MPALDEVQPAPPVATPKPPVPTWQRWRLFRFVGSLQLAVVLLGVIIVASIFGTIYESRFDADVARAYVYGAAWFNFWLLFLVVNLAASAFSRWPWKRRHTGFLITHLGIIIILAGAYVGRIWGVEGTMTLFKGRAPDNRLLVQQRQLYVTEGGANRPAATFPVRVVGRRPSAAKPWNLGRTPNGWTVELTDYSPFLSASFQPEAARTAEVIGQPAAHLRLVSPRLGRSMDRWLMAGDEDHDSFDLGMASVRLVAGAVPVGESQTSNLKSQIPARGAGTEDTVDEIIVAFAKRPGDQAGQPAPDQAGQPAPGKAASGAKVRLSVNGNRRLVNVEWRGAAWEFDADADRGKDEDLGNSGLFVRIGDLWPDFTMKDGQPATVSDQPNNPAVMVRVHGRLTAPAEGDAPDATASTAAPAGENAATLYCDEGGAITYSLRSGGSPQPVTGTLVPGHPINTGWADWQIAVDRVLPRAIDHTVFEPSETRPKGGPMSGGGGAGPNGDGVRVRLSQPGQPTHEQWVGAGWQVTTPTTGRPDDRPVQLVYGWQIEPLPIGLELTGFEVERNEGTDDPAGFKSTLRVTANDGRTDTGSCWMNNPHNFPGGPLHTWTGFTYKISQASWNPENLDQSSVQILRDPGWLLKWIGCLLLCAGIATLFYGRPHAGETAAAKARLSKP